jgi:hypothetical protein
MSQILVVTLTSFVKSTMGRPYFFMVIQKVKTALVNAVYYVTEQVPYLQSSIFARYLWL